jgi:DNA-binding transcriptional LysR family regulator
VELRHLRYFVTVAEERHFGRAAERLHMAQPPLSQQIRQLETELGVTLLHRTTRRVELTPAGEAYLVRARAVLDAVQEATVEARQVQAGLVGRITIGCVGSATYSLLPLLARELRAELPGIEFGFRGEMLVPEQVAALQDGAIDVALLRPPFDERGLEVTLLRRERLIVALPESHRLASRRRLRVVDLRDEDLIVHASRRGAVMYDTVLRLCRDAGFEPRFRHEVAETSTLVTLVAGGLGIAVVPQPVSAFGVPGATYRPLIGVPAGVKLVVAHRATDPAPHVARAVAAVVRLVRRAER